MKGSAKTLIFLLLASLLSCMESNRTNPNFTAEERKWLQDNPVIVLSVDNTYPPLNFQDENGTTTGLNVALVRLIEEKLGITIILEGSSWDEALRKAMNHEVDGIVNATKLSEREKKLSFTQNFMQDPQTLITIKGYEHNGELEDFEDATIAVKRNSIHYEELVKLLPVSKLVQVSNLQEGIKLLAMGEVDALYDDFAPVYHLISNNNLNNLEFVFVENTQEGSGIGLRNDDPILLAVFKKAIDSLEEAEVNDLRDQWLSIDPTINYKLVSLGFGSLIFVVMLGFAWNLTLTRKVRTRTDLLEKELAEKEKIQQELTDYKNQLEQTIRKRTEEIVEANIQLNTTNNELFIKHNELNNTISELKQTQSQLVHAEKLASLGVFTAGIAHEINNPVNYIKSASNVLFDTLEKIKTDPSLFVSRSEDIEYTKEAIKTGIDKTVSIISSLRNYAHAGDEEFVEYDLVQCVEDALLLLNNTFKYHVTIKRDLPDHMRVSCIPGKINQVFVNLISNAVQAIPEKGEIAIFGKWDGDEAVLTFQDNGSGMPKEVLQKIFDPFFTTKPAGKGTGLGLYIVHGIIAQHSGSIAVDSVINQGTTFTVRLPKLPPVG